MSTKESYTVEQTYEDLKVGLELGIDDVKLKLETGLKDLTKSEMERALTSIIDYPSNIDVFSEKERTFIKNLNGLHGLHLRAESVALGELQEEQDKLKEQENERKEN